MLFLSLLLVASLVGLAEGFLRLTGTHGPEGPLGPLHRYSEVYGWEPRKAYQMLDNGVRTTINRKGYRGSELSAKDSSALRVVLIGDSIAFGLDVDDEATFAAILGSRRRDLEVANLAVQGYDLGQELIKLEREGLQLRPEVVIVALCISNDFAEVALPVFLYDGRHPKPYFAIEDGELSEHTDHLRLSWRQRLSLFLSDHSGIYALIASRPSEAQPVQRSEHWQGRARRTLRNRRHVTDLTIALLVRMADDCKRAGIEVLVAAFPDKASYSKGSDLFREVVSSPLLGGVMFVDMAEQFRRRGLIFDEISLDGIGHLNERGHEEAANILYELLVERGLLPAQARPTALLPGSHAP